MNVIQNTLQKPGLVQRCHRGHSADVLQFPQEQPSSLHGQRLVLKGIFHIFPYLVRVFYQGRVCQAASSRVKYLTLNLALDHRVSLCLQPPSIYSLTNAICIVDSLLLRIDALVQQ